MPATHRPSSAVTTPMRRFSVARHSTGTGAWGAITAAR